MKSSNVIFILVEIRGMQNERAGPSGRCRLDAQEFTLLVISLRGITSS
jgi:hypothetical protein